MPGQPVQISKLSARWLARTTYFFFGSASPRQVLLRAGIDFIACNVALLVASLVRLSYVDVLTTDTPFHLLMQFVMQEHFETMAPLCLLTLGLFCMLQVYRPVPPGRSYKRVVLIGLACAAGALLHLGIVFLLQGFQIIAAPKRTVVLPAWGMIFTLTIASRFIRTTFGERFQVVSRGKSRNSRVEDVLVVGGAGYIGSVLTRQLLEAGYRVRILDLQFFGPESLAEIQNHPRLEIVNGDFRDVEDVVRALRGMDAVIHLAAIVGDPACAVDAETTIAVNYEAAKMMARLSRANSISRFIFASTCSVYGASDDIIDEQSELNPVSLYATTKIDAERALLEAVDDVFQPTILRLATAYGWSHRPRFDLVANLLPAKAVTEKEITVFNGEQWRPFVNTRDIARAMVMVLEAPLEDVGGEIFNVGDNSQNYTISELGHIVAGEVPGAEVKEMRNNEDPRNYRVQFDKIERILGYRAVVSLEEGIREIVEAIRAGKVTDWRDPKYSNLKQMQTGLLRVLKVEDRDDEQQLQETMKFLRRAA